MDLSRSPDGTKGQPYLGDSVCSKKEGKARIVAMLDNWTQTALTPLHDMINRILNLMPSDCNFYQDKIAAAVKGWTSSGKPVYSYDLQVASDRLPVNLQVIILSEPGSQKTAINWKIPFSRGNSLPLMES